MKTGHRRYRSTRVLACILAVMLAAVQFPGLITRADSVAIPENRRLVLTMGADLSEEQKIYILTYFGILDREVHTIVITNEDEHAYLDGKIPTEQIGTHTLSCALIRVTDAGGVNVKLGNINYVTSNTIASTLSTSGVYNAEVLAAAPFPVSGTGALTGAMMAYEAATGLELDPEKKDLANDELVLTGELAEQVGQDEAALVVNDIKIHIVRDQLKEEEDIRNVVDEVVATAEQAVNAAAQAQGFDAPAALGQAEHEKLYDFGYKYGLMEYNYLDLQHTLERVTHNITQNAGIDDPIEDTFETLDEDSFLDPDSILLGTEDDVLGEDANINATNSAALGEHEAEQIEVYTGDVRLTESGGVKADGFVSGSNLVMYKDLNGSYALMDLNGNVVTESLYTGYFSFYSGYIRAQLNDGSGLRGLLRTDGSTAIPCSYEDIEVLGDKWAAGIVLKEANADKYDYTGSGGGYYLIDHLDIFYLASGGAEPVGSLTREQYLDAHAKGDYLNVEDRNSTVTTYDSGLNALRTAEDKYDFGEYDEDGALLDRIYDQTGYFPYSFSGNYTEITDSGSKHGVMDRYGNVIIPVQFDDIYRDWNGRYEEHGYFGAEQEGKFAYVTQGGNVTGTFDVPADEVDNYGMSASYSAPDGSVYLLAGDGVMTNLGEQDSVRSITASGGMFWKLQNESGKYDLLDWHGNVLLSGCDDYSVSANGNYLIAQDGYTSSTLYRVNDASEVSIAGTAGGAAEVEAVIEEGASLDLYTGPSGQERAGTLTASRFVEGTDLIAVWGEDGYALADLSGNLLTEDVWSGFRYRNGWLVVSDQEGLKEGLMSADGEQILPCEYDRIEVLDQDWAAAYTLTAGGTEEDYDFSRSEEYYLIKEAKICYLSGEELTYLSLTRDQIADLYAEGGYVNIKDRTSGLVTTYDSSLQPVASSDSLYSIEMSAERAQIRKLRDSTGLYAWDSGFVDGYLRMSDSSRETANIGVADMNGEMILPCEYDDVLNYYSVFGSRFWASGYFGVELDGLDGYVGAGGEVTCDLKYDEERFQNCGVSGALDSDDGTITIVAADGVESSGYAAAFDMGGSGKYWKVRMSDDSYEYNVVDWHGNVLFENVDDADVSADDRYMLIWRDYSSTAELYALDGAPVPSGASLPEEGQAEPAAETEPAQEQTSAEAAPEEAQDAGGQPGSAESVLAGALAALQDPSDSSVDEPGEQGDAEDLLNQALELTEADYAANQDQVLSILKQAQEQAAGTAPEAAQIIQSAIVLIEGGAAGGDTVTTLINSAVSLF